MRSNGQLSAAAYLSSFDEEEMQQIDTIFDRMDAWRHLPNYQLERRADLFFSLYLPEVLESKLGYSVAEHIVPEFPVRIGTIYPDIPIDKSYKIDYVALSPCRLTLIRRFLLN